MNFDFFALRLFIESGTIERTRLLDVGSDLVTVDACCWVCCVTVFLVQ